MPAAWGGHRAARGKRAGRGIVYFRSSPIRTAVVAAPNNQDLAVIQQGRRGEPLGLIILPVGLKSPVAGSYNSAVARPVKPFDPPAMRTFPLFNNVAVFPPRGVLIAPVAANVPVAGSYNSAVARGTELLPSLPPVMRTLPSFSNVAV